MFRKLLKNPSRLPEFGISRSRRASTLVFTNPRRSKPSFLAGPPIGSLPSPSLRVITRSYCDADDHLPKEDFSKPLVKLTFVTPDDEEVEIQGRVGLTLMQEAVRNNLPMEAACRGQLSCTSCHCYVEEHAGKDPESLDPLLTGMAEDEIDLLDNLPVCQPNSRLTCQIIVSQDCENARFRITDHTSSDQSASDNQVDVSLERS